MPRTVFHAEMDKLPEEQIVKTHNRWHPDLPFVETFKVLPDKLELLILFILSILWSNWPVLIHLEKDRLSRIVVHELSSRLPGQFVGISFGHLLARVEMEQVDQ